MIKNYKPLSGLNVFIGSSVKETFKYLANNLENEIKDDILNYLMKKIFKIL